MEERDNPKDGSRMILIPAGSFVMGEGESAHLPAYWIYREPVRVWQYRMFCTATERRMPVAPVFDLEWRSVFSPIVNVSWEEARAYCDWAGVSLPTESQWEKAARGTDGREYPWGNEWDARLCVNSAQVWAGGTEPVGGFARGASPYGVLDMSGNVWEWCSDVPDLGVDAPYLECPSTQMMRVIRGGGWDGYLPRWFRCANRAAAPLCDAQSSIGFRCCLPAEC